MIGGQQVSSLRRTDQRELIMADAHGHLVPGGNHEAVDRLEGEVPVE